MAIRRQHTDAEIAALAERFGQSWSEGQLIRPWLRAHGGELMDLVRRADWAWINLGRTLTLAGIAYRTGRPWTGENLRRPWNGTAQRRLRNPSSDSNAPSTR